MLPKRQDFIAADLLWPRVIMETALTDAGESRSSAAQRSSWSIVDELRGIQVARMHIVSRRGFREYSDRQISYHRSRIGHSTELYVIRPV